MAQRREVVRLQGVQRDQRRVLNEILALLDELAANTIDRQLAKSDTQQGDLIAALDVWSFVAPDAGAERHGMPI